MAVPAARPPDEPRGGPDPRRDPVRAATLAVYVAFTACGFGLSTYVARLAQVRSHLHLSTGQLGAVLLAAAGGALLFRPLTARIIARLGQRATVAASALVAAVGQALLGIGDLTGLLPVIAGLVLMGFASAGWDVAMNIQGVRIEHRIGRSIMPRFHAAYSIGTVAGALLGSLMIVADVPIAAHMILTAALIGLTVPPAVRGFLPDEPSAEAAAVPRRDRAAAAARDGAAAGDGPRSSYWLEPRTVLIGLFVLAFAFAQGAGNDWISIGVVDGYQTQPIAGTLAYAAFLTALTAVRWFGAPLLDRYGRVPVLRALCVIATVGLLLFSLGPSPVAAFVGVALWGAGVAFGYPVGLSAAADDPRHATRRVTVASTIGKVASLAGPPLVGLLGDHVTLRHALIAVAVLQVIALFLASATKPLRGVPAAAGGTAKTARPESAEQAADRK